MPSCSLTTFFDLVQSVLDYVGADPSAEANRYARAAVLAAMRDLGGTRHWSYFLQHGQLLTVAPFAAPAATVSYAMRSSCRR